MRSRRVYMANYIDDVADFLEDQGIGTVGTNLFIGRTIDSDDSSLPNNIVVLYETGGIEPSHYIPTKNPTFQVYVRNTDYALGRAKIEAVRTALHQTYGDTIGSTYFYTIFAQSEPGYIGRDEPDANGREEFSINFIAYTR